MNNNGSGAVLATLLGLGIGITTLILATAGRAEAKPPEPPLPEEELPTPGDILMAGSIAELNAWYNLIGELYITGKIHYDEYLTLYDAYEERWYQLTGVS